MDVASGSRMHHGNVTSLNGETGQNSVTRCDVLRK